MHLNNEHNFQHGTEISNLQTQAKLSKLTGSAWMVIYAQARKMNTIMQAAAQKMQKQEWDVHGSNHRSMRQNRNHLL